MNNKIYQIKNLLYIVYLLMIYLNVKYSIDETLVYPKWILELYKDNFFRFLIYVIIYISL